MNESDEYFDSTYETLLLKESADLLSESRPIDEIPLRTRASTLVPYSSDQLRSIIVSIEKYWESMDFLSLTEVSRKMGRSMHSLSLFGSKDGVTDLSLAHSVYSTALREKGNGKQPIVILNYDSKGDKQHNSIHLLTRNIKKYEVSHFHKKGFDVSRTFLGNLNKELVSAGFREVTLIEYDVREESDLPRVPSLDSKEFKADFEFARSLVETMMDFSSQDADLVLRDFMTKMGKADERSKLFKTSKALSGISVDEVVEMLKVNNEASSKLLTKMISTLNTPVDKEEYLEPHFKRLNACETRPLFRFPAALRTTEFDISFPGRAKRIRESIESQGQTAGYLITLLGFLEDSSVHPTFLETLILEDCPDYDIFNGVSMRRLKSTRKDTLGQLTSVIELTFSGTLKCFNDLTSSDGILKKTWGHKKSLKTFTDLEKDFLNEEKLMLDESTGSKIGDDISLLIGSVMTQDSVSDFVRKTMRATYNDVKNSFVLSTISNWQEMCHAISMVPRKNKLITKTGTYGSKHRRAYVSVDMVSDRLMLVLTNMSVPFNEVGDMSVIPLGHFVETSSILVNEPKNGLAKPFVISAAQLDWGVTVFHKTVSWITLERESSISSGTTTVEQWDPSVIVFPSLIAMVNSSKFSQASEMTRYVTVNTLGISSPPTSLFDKISWFTPKTHVEKLYMLRLIKMSSFITLVKSYDLRGKLIRTSKSVFSDGIVSDHTFIFKNWDIAFPHERHTVISDQHFYNSFYVCRALSIQRYQRVMSESLVLKKQLESRDSFISIRSEMRDHEARCRALIESKDQLIQMFLSEDYVSRRVSENSPNPLVIALGVLSTLRKRGAFRSVREMAKGYNLSSVLDSLCISDVMNNKGSMMSMGSHGVATCTKITREEKGKLITEKLSQSDKCYSTACQAIYKVSMNESDGRQPDRWPAEIVTPQRFVWNSEKLEIVRRSNQKLWPVLFHSMGHNLTLFSKMVHKDQIGAREIAVMVIWLRVLAYFLESLARKVRDSDHLGGIRTNLIERKDKDKIVESSYWKSRADKNSGVKVLYDSADCSQWGPTRSPVSFFITMGLRCDREWDREMLYNCLSYYSNKMFKPPDVLFDFFSDNQDITGSNVVHDTWNKLKASNYYYHENQVFESPEGMYQGTLGCTSSVEGSDCLNLVKLTLESTKHSQRLTVIPYCTSDDYVKIMSWTGDDTHSQMVRYTLALQDVIGRSYGIKRNMEKSTHSPQVLEFNSVFYCPNGVIKPDLKSRLSYIDISQEVDPYPSALRCLTVSCEYLRQEGSLIGSLWCQLLNTHLSMIQHQGMKLYREIGDEIFKLPLELGGYPEINTLKAVIGPQYMHVANNYGMEKSLSLAMSIMDEIRPTSMLEIDESLEKEMINKVPSMTRSGTVHLCKPSSRQRRQMREFLSNLSRECYTDFMYCSRGESFLPALMACIRREETSEGDQSAARRLSICATPSDKKLYLLNSNLLQEFSGKRLVSRDEIRDLAREWLSSEVIEYENGFKIGNASVERVKYPTDVSEEIMRMYNDFVKSIVIHKVVPVTRESHVHPYRISLVPSNFEVSMREQFKRRYMPRELGGSTDVEPLRYLECSTVFYEKLKDLSGRVQTFKFTLREGDGSKNIVEKILVSNYMGGCRAMYRSVSGIIRSVSFEENYLQPAMSMLSKENMDNCEKFGSSKVKFVDSYFQAAVNSYKVSKIDITELLNASNNTSASFFFSDFQVKMAFWWKAYEVFRDRNMLCVTPSDLDLSLSNREFIGFQNRRIYQRPLLSPDLTLCGIEVIKETSKGLTHYMNYTRDYGHHNCESDKENEFLENDVSKMRTLEVYLQSVEGFLSICDKEGNIITILCSAPMDKPFKLGLAMTGPWISDKSTVDYLDLKSDISAQRRARLNYLYSAFEGVPVDNNMDTVEQEEIEFDLLDNDAFDFDIGDGFSDLVEDDSMFKSRDPVDPILKKEDDDDEFFARMSDEVSLGQPYSRESLYVPKFQFGSKLLSGRYKRDLSKAKELRSQGKRVLSYYEIELPIDPGIDIFYQNESEDLIESVLRHFESKGTAEATWVFSYLKDSLKNTSEFMSEFRGLQ